jgi:outer membrane protein insertion porin family
LLISCVSAQLLEGNTLVSEKNQIREVLIEGNQFVDEDLIRTKLRVLSAQAYHPSALRQKVRESIENLYASGFFSEVSADADYLDNGQGMDLIFSVKEHSALEKLTLSGMDNLLEEDLLLMISLKEGQVYSPSQIERDRQKLLDHYKSEGYLLAEIGVEEVAVEGGKALVTFNIREGKKVMITEINISGNLKVDADEIIGRMDSELDRWWGNGEFKEEVFRADLDTVIYVAKHHGYLDAEILDSRVEYIPDPSFHFYLGKITRNKSTLADVLKSINADINKQNHPLTLASGDIIQGKSHYYRRYRSSYSARGQALPPALLKSEEDIAFLFNKLISLSPVRKNYLESQNKPEGWGVLEIDSLFALKNKTEKDEKRLTRLILENQYPVMAYDNINTSSKVKLYVKMQEGRRYYAGLVTFIGNEVLSDAMLYSQVALDSGDIFDYQKYEATKMGMMSLYREDGYLFAQLNPEESYRDSIVNVSFNIVEGLPANIHKVFIRGNTKTKDKVIRREIKLFPGDTYRQSLMERSFRDIMQLNYFDNVLPDIKVVGEQDVDLVFDVVEREAGTGTFSAGMAYSARDGLVGTLGLAIPNCCMGDGQEATVNVEYGKLRENYAIGFSEPWFMDWPIRVGGSVNYTWYAGQNGQEDVTRKGFNTYLGKRLTWPDDYFYTQVGYGLQINDQGVDPNPGSLIRRSGTESSVTYSLIRDDKNLPIFPTEGSRYSVTFQKVFWDFNFLKTDLSIKWWFPIIGDLALRIENETGFITGDEIQYRTLYQMGGILGYQGKLRGYSPGSIGLRRMGRSYYNFTSELTYPIAENRFYLLGFFDAGNVFGPVYDLNEFQEPNRIQPWEEMNLNVLKKDLGFGFRVIVPMLGIIGFDFGWPLDPAESWITGEDELNPSYDMEFHFVIGQGF